MSTIHNKIQSSATSREVISTFGFLTLPFLIYIILLVRGPYVLERLNACRCADVTHIALATHKRQ
jgi:hypothetical protein